MWHELASRPFYVALDTAYAAADDAMAGVELDAIVRQARSALENGKLNEASRKFREVLAKDDKHAKAIAGLGWTFLAMGKAEEASKQFKRSIKINSRYGDAYIGLGTAHRQQGQLKEAYDAYDEYMGRFPKGPKASIATYQMDQLKKQLGM